MRCKVPYWVEESGIRNHGKVWPGGVFEVMVTTPQGNRSMNTYMEPLNEQGLEAAGEREVPRILGNLLCPA
jgi:hypothetical protein